MILQTQQILENREAQQRVQQQLLIGRNAQGVIHIVHQNIFQVEMH